MTSSQPIFDPDLALPSIEHPSLFKPSKQHHCHHHTHHHITQPSHRRSSLAVAELNRNLHKRAPIHSFPDSHDISTASQIWQSHTPHYIPTAVNLIYPNSIDSFCDYDTTATDYCSSACSSEGSSSDSDSSDEIPARLPPPPRLATSKSGNRDLFYGASVLSNSGKRPIIHSLPHRFPRPASILQDLDTISVDDTMVHHRSNISLQSPVGTSNLAKRRHLADDHSLSLDLASKRIRKEAQFQSVKPSSDRNQWTHSVNSSIASFSNIDDLAQGTPPRKQKDVPAVEQHTESEDEPSPPPNRTHPQTQARFRVVPSTKRQLLGEIDFQLPQFNRLSAVCCLEDVERVTEPYQLPKERALWPLWRYLSYLLRKFEKMPSVQEARGAKQKTFLADIRDSIDTAHKGVSTRLNELFGDSDPMALPSFFNEEIAHDIRILIIPIVIIILRKIFEASKVNYRGVTGNGPVYRMSYDVCSSAHFAIEWLVRMAHELEDEYYYDTNALQEAEAQSDNDGFDAVKGFDPKKKESLTSLAEAIQKKLKEAMVQFAI